MRKLSSGLLLSAVLAMSPFEAGAQNAPTAPENWRGLGKLRHDRAMHDCTGVSRMRALGAAGCRADRWCLPFWHTAKPV